MPQRYVPQLLYPFIGERIHSSLNRTQRRWLIRCGPQRRRPIVRSDKPRLTPVLNRFIRSLPFWYKTMDPYLRLSNLTRKVQQKLRNNFLGSSSGADLRERSVKKLCRGAFYPLAAELGIGRRSSRYLSHGMPYLQLRMIELVKHLS